MRPGVQRHAGERGDVAPLGTERAVHAGHPDAARAVKIKRLLCGSL